MSQDEYLRLVESPTLAEAAHMFVDTIYGTWLHADALPADVVDSFTVHLRDELAWLADTVDQPNILSFITARYDALNIARVLIDYHYQQPGEASDFPMGSVGHSLLFSIIWHNIGWEAIPPVWQATLRREYDLSRTSLDISALLARLEHDYLAVLDATALTPLTRTVAEYMRNRLAADAALRPLGGIVPADRPDVPAIVARLHQQGYTRLTVSACQAVAEAATAIAYEREWDNELIVRLHSHKHQPVGDDPIVAYWYFKELEVKTLRLLLLAKASGYGSDVLHELRRLSFNVSV